MEDSVACCHKSTASRESYYRHSRRWRRSTYLEFDKPCSNPQPRLRIASWMANADEKSSAALFGVNRLVGLSHRARRMKLPARD